MQIKANITKKAIILSLLWTFLKVINSVVTVGMANTINNFTFHLDSNSIFVNPVLVLVRPLYM